MKQHKFERRDNKQLTKNQQWENKNRNEDREVSAKKGLGQHFLIDMGVADAIGDILPTELDAVLEIGPGMGVLTQRLFPRFGERLLCVELDRESVEYLHRQAWGKGLSATFCSLSLGIGSGRAIWKQSEN